MAKRVSRKLELFTMHAHGMPIMDYSKIFKAFASLPRGRRISNVNGIYIGFPHVIEIEGGYFIQAMEGDPDALQLIFDLSTGEAKESNLGVEEIFGQATHFVIAPDSRSVAIEYVRRGAKALLLGPSIAEIIRQNFPEYNKIQLEFLPKIERGFLEEINSFDRIRIASIRIKKPNASWTDHYSDLSDLMDSSDGDKASLDVRAGRGESLRKNDGIVKVIKDIAEDKYPYIEDAAVTGTRRDEGAETTVRSRSHVVHSRVVVEADNTGAAYDTSIRKKLLEFILPWISA